jgi:hypothetical protein
VISLRDHLPVGDVSITPQRRHDNPAAPPQTFAPGSSPLFDLGYIDVARFITMTEQGAFLVKRFKESHNPEIVRVHVGLGSKREAQGMKLDEALGYVLHDDKGLIDVDVRLIAGERTAVVRAVATVDSEGTRYWYLTNVAREVLSVQDVADTYRLCWEIELFVKQVNSGAGLSALLAWRASAVQALVYSRIIALCLARLLELSVEERIGRHAAVPQVRQHFVPIRSHCCRGRPALVTPSFPMTESSKHTRNATYQSRLSAMSAQAETRSASRPFKRLLIPHKDPL